MRFTIQVLIESPGRVATQRPDSGQPIVPVSESRTWALRLRRSQGGVAPGSSEQLIRQQLAEYLEARRPCPDCRQLRTIKGYHRRRFRSAFGDLSLRSPRWCRCECAKPFGSRELQRAELDSHHSARLRSSKCCRRVKWAAHVSFAAVADLLHDVLPGRLVHQS